MAGQQKRQRQSRLVVICCF